MNDFIEAAKDSSDEDEGSEARFNKLKKEEAGTERKDPVKQRYDELKEKAKKEYKRQEEKRKEREKQEEEEDDESFVTY